MSKSASWLPFRLCAVLLVCFSTNIELIAQNSPTDLRLEQPALSFSSEELISQGPRRLLDVRGFGSGLLILHGGQDGAATVIQGDGRGEGWTPVRSVSVPMVAPLNLRIPADDRVRIWDQRTGRLVELDIGGSFLLDAHLTWARPLLSLFGTDPYIAIQGPDLERGAPPTLAADSGAILAGSDSLSVIRRLPPHGPISLRREPDPSTGFLGGNLFARRLADPVPHADATSACGGVIAIAVGNTDFRILLLDMNARVVGVLEKDATSVAIPQHVRSQYLDRLDPDMRSHVESLGVSVVPRTWPVINGLSFVKEGLLFVATRTEEDGEYRSVWRLRRTNDGVSGRETHRIFGAERWSLTDVSHGLIWGLTRNAGTQVVAFDVPDSLGIKGASCFSGSQSP